MMKSKTRTNDNTNESIKKSFNDFLFETLNSKRIYSAPIQLHESMYGGYKASDTQYWMGDYKDFGINQSFLHEENLASNNPSSKFKMAYVIWEPAALYHKPISPNDIVTLVLTNGVPVVKEEWVRVASKLSRFIRIIMVDLHGMGESSKPLTFKVPSEQINFLQKKGGIFSLLKKTNGWLWSWRWQAEVFKRMFTDFKQTYPEWFLNGKIFFGANDWGAGVVQKFTELYGSEFLHGANINSAITLNGYWVQHIGAFKALAEAPYPSPGFDNAVIQFVGTLTLLLESMHYRTDEIHNQYTMAWLQKPFVEISYSNPNKNPSNTKYNSHAVRVLAEQANYALGNGELLPYHSRFNPEGMDFTRFDVKILMLWGKQDKMMPEKQVHDHDNIYSHLNSVRKNNGIPSNLRFQYKVIDKAGHFAITDQPEQSADAMLTWIQNIVGPEHLATTFHGFDSLARQDEKHVTDRFDVLNQSLRDSIK